MWGLYEEDVERYDAMCKNKDGHEYLECPHCQKKNWLASRHRTKEGLGVEAWISHVTE